jgi:hypothetical protein
MSKSLITKLLVLVSMIYDSLSGRTIMERLIHFLLLFKLYNAHFLLHEYLRYLMFETQHIEQLRFILSHYHIEFLSNHSFPKCIDFEHCCLSNLFILFQIGCQPITNSFNFIMVLVSQMLNEITGYFSLVNPKKI